MWLVACDPADRGAVWAYAGLRDRGLEPLELVSLSELAYSVWSEHRLGKHGASFEIELQSGRRLVSCSIKGVLNRVSRVPTDHLAFSSEIDFRYAVEELNALVLSWLECVSSFTVNRASPRGLAGAWRSPAEWAFLAAQAGFSVPPFRLSSYRVEAAEQATAKRRTCLVFGGRLLDDDFPAGIAECCARLARISDTELLEVELQADQKQRFQFSGATPMPDLRIGGRKFVDELYRRFTSQRA